MTPVERVTLAVMLATAGWLFVTGVRRITASKRRYRETRRLAERHGVKYRVRILERYRDAQGNDNP